MIQTKTAKEKDICARIKTIKKNLSISFNTSPEAKRDAKSRLSELTKELKDIKNNRKQLTIPAH